MRLFLFSLLLFTCSQKLQISLLLFFTHFRTHLLDEYTIFLSFIAIFSIISNIRMNEAAIFRLTNRDKIKREQSMQSIVQVAALNFICTHELWVSWREFSWLCNRINWSCVVNYSDKSPESKKFENICSLLLEISAPE